MLKLFKQLKFILNKIFLLFILFLLKFYQIFLSNILFFLGAQCRYYPSCSHYSREAFIKHGIVRGASLTIKRLSRCHPNCAGGIDLVPDK